MKKPSKYAKTVVEEIEKHFARNKQMKLNLSNNNKEEELNITWIEGDGVGYCLTEDDYNEREKEVKQHLKEEMEK